MKLVFLAVDGEDLVILSSTAFDWSTRVTDRRTDRQTELRWLRRAESSIAAFARKKSAVHPTIFHYIGLYCRQITVLFDFHQH